MLIGLIDITCVYDVLGVGNFDFFIEHEWKFLCITFGTCYKITDKNTR